MMRVQGNNVLRRLGRGAAAGGSALLLAVQFVLRMLGRVFAIDLLRVGVTEREVEALRDSALEDPAVMQYLAWRRAMLLWACVLTALNLGWQIVESVDMFVEMGETVAWTPWAYLVEGTRLVAVALVPTSAFLAFVWWRRPRLSGTLLMVGLALAYLVPVVQVAVPAHIWFDWGRMDHEFKLEIQKTLEQEGHPPDAMPPFLSKPFKDLTVVYGFLDTFLALLTLVYLVPSLCAMFPGIMRGCLRVKTLMPEAITPGWFMLCVVPLYLIFLLILCALFSMVYRFPELAVAMVLLAAVPLFHLLNLKSMLQPWRGPGRRQALGILGWVGTFFNLMAVSLILWFFASHPFSIEGKTWYILSWLPEQQLVFGYEDIGFWLADLFGRSLVITLVVADLLLRATIALWRHAGAVADPEGLRAFEQLTTPN
jgi:hypothetical protein